MNRARAAESFQDGIEVTCRALRSVGITGAIAKELLPAIIGAARREPAAETTIAHVYAANTAVRRAWPAMRRALGIP